MLFHPLLLTMLITDFIAGPLRQGQVELPPGDITGRGRQLVDGMRNLASDPPNHENNQQDKSDQGQNKNCGTE